MEKKTNQMYFLSCQIYQNLLFLHIYIYIYIYIFIWGAIFLLNILKISLFLV